MNYSADGIEALNREFPEVDRRLNDLLRRVAEGATGIDNTQAREFLLEGVGRRLRLIRRSLQIVFDRFPPSTRTPLDSDSLDEVVIALHAFLINTYGLFDNLAWAFISRHDLETRIGDRKRIGFFREATTREMPAALRAYAQSERMQKWAHYLKNYRDALAHRIAPYVPPAMYAPDEHDRYKQLDREALDAIHSHDWPRLEAIEREQEQLGRACMGVAHSFSESDSSRPVYLHPQMISDALTILEACSIYFDHWDEAGAR